MTHMALIVSLLTDKYMRMVNQRSKIANQPRRQMRMIEDAGIGGMGKINQLTSGAGQHQPFNLTVRLPLCVR